MKFQLTDEQRALQEAVRDYLGDKFGQQQVRAFYEEDDETGVPEGLWKAIGKQGWLAVMVPEEHDGIGLGLLDAAVIARAFGAATVPGPWLGTVLAGEAIRLAGSPDQQAKWLPSIAAGEVEAAVALLQPGTSDQPAARATNGSLSGDLGLVEYAAQADLLVVAADDGLYLVEPSAATIAPQTVLDRTVRLATVTLDGAAAEKLDGGNPLPELLDRAAVLVANDLVGIARKALSDTVEYDKTRIQFGKPVGSFQAIKHDLADIHLAVTMAEHAALYAAHAQDVDLADKAVAASIAKAKAGDTADAATSAMIQYHGGIGYTWEHDAHFYLKRAKRQQYAYGDAAQHRERIARLVLDSTPAGGVPHGGESGGMAVGTS